MASSPSARSSSLAAKVASELARRRQGSSGQPALAGRLLTRDRSEQAPGDGEAAVAAPEGRWVRPVPVGATLVRVMGHASGLDPEPGQRGADRLVAPAVEADADAGVDESSVPGARLLAVEVADLGRARECDLADVVVRGQGCAGVAEAGTVPSRSGPRRTIFATTPSGKRMLAKWLREPVTHVRDARSLLMLKLLFLTRRDADPRRLLVAQRDQFSSLVASLSDAVRAADGFEYALLIWRLEATTAAVRFTEAMLAQQTRASEANAEAGGVAVGAQQTEKRGAIGIEDDQARFATIGE